MINLILIVVSLILVVKMADVFVDQATALSKKLKVSGFFVGFLLVSLGTSLPELATSLYSSSIGHTEIAISNVIGSNIANILLVLGSLALFCKYRLRSIDVNFNIPLLLSITSASILVIAINNYIINSFLGIILLLVFIISSYLINRNNHTNNIHCTTKFNILFLIGSVILIVLFSRICIDNILIFANQLNLPEVLIGYFLLAFGTSLPEFATLYSSLKKGREDVGLGSIIGSNMFNLLFILGTSSLITTLDLKIFKLELLFVLIVTGLLMIFGLVGKKNLVSRREAVMLLSFYLLFVLIQLLKTL